MIGLGPDQRIIARIHCQFEIVDILHLEAGRVCIGDVTRND